MPIPQTVSHCSFLCSPRPARLFRVTCPLPPSAAAADFFGCGASPSSHGVDKETRPRDHHLEIAHGLSLALRLSGSGAALHLLAVLMGISEPPMNAVPAAHTQLVTEDAPRRPAFSPMTSSVSTPIQASFAPVSPAASLLLSPSLVVDMCYSTAPDSW
ncbi:hypothetical protein IWX90DRAFT_260722 [Phyllosticta citrichinensis]|uniref:Uncharacterized protein n=1 Tax=Phyllosticta citrichinensis TaxID=1130410 RepID=A0ABR1XRY1_9PEZI